MKISPTVAVGLLAASSLSAQTRIHVNASAPPGGDGSNWAAPFQDLQAALAAAEASAGDDEVWVAAGTYHPDPGRSNRASSFVLRDGVAIYGGFRGTEGELSERNADPATNGTVLSGDLAGDDTAGFGSVGENSMHVVVGTGTTATARLDGFTIRGGNADTLPLAGGGGLLCDKSGSPTVVGCLFTANRASFGGGAVSLTRQSPGVTAPTFTDCLFIGNEGGYGGAVEAASSQPSFLRCRLFGNHGRNGGGAIYNYYSASRLEACSLRGNRTGANGGAIYFQNVDPAGRTVIVNCEFTGNQANFGGACYSYAYALPVFTNCSFHGNRAIQLGGALYQSFGAVPRLANCIVAGNHAAAAASDLDHSLTSNNVLPEFSHSLVAHSGGSGGWLAAAGTDLGGNLDGDPRFLGPIDPLDAPSTAGNVRLLLGSPAANQGDNLVDLDGAGAGTQTLADLATDLAGAARVQDATVEMGAFEGTFDPTLTSFAFAHPALHPEADANGNGFSNFLDYATGADPLGPDEPDLRPALYGRQLRLAHRAGTTDVFPRLARSTDLADWTPMEEGSDYLVLGTSSEGQVERTTVELTDGTLAAPRVFFRQEFQPR